MKLALSGVTQIERGGVSFLNHAQLMLNCGSFPLLGIRLVSGSTISARECVSWEGVAISPTLPADVFVDLTT